MRSVYTAEIEVTGLNPTAGDTVLFLQSPSDMVLEILSASLTNYNVDTAEQLEAGLFYVDTIGDATGSPITPTKHELGDVASTAIAYGAVSSGLLTEPTTYSAGAIDRQGFNNLAGYFYNPVPEEKPVVSPSSAVGLRLLSVPSTGFNAVAQIVYREIGG